jgi:hypothetical protein
MEVNLMEIREIEKWLSRTRAARELGLSDQGVGNLMNQGKLNFIQTDLGRLVDPVDLQRLIKERAKKTTPS